MIWCHELLTGFQIAMVENTEEDDDEYADKVTEVACTIQARNSTRKLVFELASTNYYFIDCIANLWNENSTDRCNPTIGLSNTTGFNHCRRSTVLLHGTISN